MTQVVKLIMIYQDGSNLAMCDTEDELGTYSCGFVGDKQPAIPREAFAARDAVRKSTPGGRVFLIVEDA
jgi:hypothetical protein